MANGKLAALVLLLIPVGALIFLGVSLYKKYRYKKEASRLKLYGDRKAGEVDDQELGNVIGGGDWLYRDNLDARDHTVIDISNEFDPLAAHAESARDRKARRRVTLMERENGGDVYSSPEHTNTDEEEEEEHAHNNLYQINAAKLDAEEEDESTAEATTPEKGKAGIQKLAEQLRGTPGSGAPPTAHRRENSTAQFENILLSVAPAPAKLSEEFHQKTTTPVPALQLQNVRKETPPAIVHPAASTGNSEEYEEEEEEEEEEPQQGAKEESHDDEDYEYEYEEEEDEEDVR
ncbi:hypothetical protein ADEAN_000587000 [Angomonas deanei]|uniref:Uncharacterized protein n=1 Tax=Angomonas deanei TaxID=59799 RepID=A0A7G2CJE2_9TRYP|nr:hypothetical protein ADEAN_000587000 [Angomonas deanei]